MPNVIISISGASEEQQQLQKQTQQSKIKTIGQVAVASAFTHQILNTTKQAISFAINNVGNFTGDYNRQKQLQAGMEVLGDLATIGTGISAGGVVGGIIAVAGIATREIFEGISNFQDINHKNIQANYLRDRAGGISDNSRGTEN